LKVGTNHLKVEVGNLWIHHVQRGSADPLFRVCGFSLSPKDHRPWEAAARYTAELFVAVTEA
jgi:hypothetical protein